MELGFRLFQHGLRFAFTIDAWVIEGPHEREWDTNMKGNHHNIGLMLSKHREPVAEIGWALLTKDQYWPWENDYHTLLEWTGKARDIDVAGELARAAERLRPGDRVAVLGCGGVLPSSLPPAVLFDFDRELLAQATRASDTGHHAIGMRTPLADHSVDVVLMTSRLAGLWDRWGLDLVAEARRIGREVHAPGFGV